MYKIFFSTLIAVAFSFNCQAQDAIAATATESVKPPAQEYDAQIDEITNKLTEGMNEVAGQLNQAMTETVPVMVNGLAEMMKEMIRVMAPTMIAIQEGKKLPLATDQMAEEVKNTISHKYTSKVTYDINNEVNELKINGEYEENNTKLKFEISRNLAQSLLIKDMIDGNAQDGVLGENATIENLDGDDIPLSSFENFDIDGNSFVGYDDSENQTIYLLTNVGAYISMRIQAKGENYKKVGSDFIYSFDYAAMKEAVDDDGRTIEDIKKIIDEQLSNPVKLKELMSQMRGQN